MHIRMNAMKNTKRYLVKHLWYLLDGEKPLRMFWLDPNLGKRISNWAFILVVRNAIV